VAGTLFSTYQEGGTFSTTSGQHTFNWGVMNQTVGNGTTAAQSYRVPVGEVTVAGSVVTAITWYALNRLYDSGRFAVAAGQSITKTHNIGLLPSAVKVLYSDDSVGTNEREAPMGNSQGSGTFYGYHQGAKTRTSVLINTEYNGVALGVGLTLSGVASGFYRVIVSEVW
jgi:hypothetical protein